MCSMYNVSSLNTRIHGVSIIFLEYIFTGIKGNSMSMTGLWRSSSFTPPSSRQICMLSLSPRSPWSHGLKKKTDDVSFCNVVNLGFVCPFFGFYVSMDMIHPLLIYYLIKASTRTSVYCMGYFYFFSVRKDRPGTFYEYVHVEWWCD